MLGHGITLFNEEEEMSGLDIYILILCVIVFSLLTAVSVVMITYFVKSSTKMIKHGLEDEKTEYYKAQKENRFVGILANVLSFVIFAALLLAFLLSLGVKLCSDSIKCCLPVPQIVLSDSMAYKHEENTYLTENGLDDQFAAFDLIFTRELPGEFELELYDIVVYEYYGDLIIGFKTFSASRRLLEKCR